VSHAPKATVDLTIFPEGDPRSKQFVYVSDDDGATYVAGSKPSGPHAFVLGQDLGTDGGLYLFKIDAAGKPVWKRRFGTTEVDQEDAVVSLNLNAQGELVLVADVARSYSPEEPVQSDHELGIFRFAKDGDKLAELTFTVPYEVWLVAAFPVADQLYVTGVFQDAFQLGGVQIAGTPGQTTFLARIDEQGVPVTTVTASTLDFVHVVIGPSGDSVLVSRDRDRNSLWQVEAHGPDLQLSWKKELAAGDEVPLLALGADDLYIATPNEPTSPYGVVLERRAMASGALLARKQVATLARAQSLLALPDDTAVLAGSALDGALVGGVHLTSRSPEGALLMQLSPELEPIWATLFCDYGGDYGYSGVVSKLRYSRDTLHAVVTGANLELGPALSPGASTQLLHFDLSLSEAQGGAGGGPP
jgi:hypothetical protein